MASSASSSSSNTPPSSTITVSPAEFELFHNIDRTLFTRLVVSLGHDPDEASRAMAYIIWLERRSKNFRLVSMLINCSDALLNVIVNEAALALNCLEDDQFRYDVVNGIDMPLTRRVLDLRRSVTLPILYEKRATIVPKVTKIMNDVCVRAFADIVQNVQRQKAAREQNVTISSNNNNNNTCRQEEGGFQRKEVNYEIDMVMSNCMNYEIDMVMSNCKGENVPSERTIFLAFSIGFPVSEVELRDFFSRYFGDVIQAVYMQQVPVRVQPLYASLVLRSDALNLMDVILDERIVNVPFTINGKYVWANKFVRN